MAKYKVISLAVNGSGGNRIYKTGEVKDETCFDDPEELVKSGHLVRDDEAEAEKEIDAVDNSDTEGDDPMDLIGDLGDDDKPEKKSYDDINVKELREITGEKNPKLKKKDLYEMYLDLA